jgi:hypothetical protein
VALELLQPDNNSSSQKRQKMDYKVSVSVRTSTGCSTGPFPSEARTERMGVLEFIRNESSFAETLLL